MVPLPASIFLFNPNFSACTLVTSIIHLVNIAVADLVEVKRTCKASPLYNHSSESFLTMSRPTTKFNTGGKASHKCYSI